MLETTGVKLDLILDVDTYQFIKKGMRSGISYIAQRCSLANNIYRESYDECKPSRFVISGDVNHLYR